jgi:hypothetical protein
MNWRIKESEVDRNINYNFSINQCDEKAIECLCSKIKIDRN